MKKWMIPLVAVSLALAVAVPTIGAALVHDGSPALSDASPSNLSLDVMYWTFIDPGTGQPDGGCATVLSWQDNSDDERGFRIERRRGGSATWRTIREVAAETTEYRDLDACGSCYRVGVVGTGGLSGYSNEACYRPEGLSIASTVVSPETARCWPDPCVTATNVNTITGTVMDVSLSARVLTLAESREGFDVVALTERTRLVFPDGGRATLPDVRPGMRVQASGRAGDSGALLAEMVQILPDEAPGPPVPRPNGP